MKKAKIFIEGMTCSACSSGIEKSLIKKGFVSHIEVNLIAKTALLEYDPKTTNLQDIFAFIKKLGYAPSTHNPNTNQNKSLIDLIKQRDFGTLDKRIFPPKIRLAISILCSVAVLYLAMLPMLVPHDVQVLIPPFDKQWANFYAQFFLALIAMHMGRDFYLKGFKTLFAKTPTMDTLIAISTSAALVYSLYSAYYGETHWYFESICVILTFVLIGKTIEQSAKDHANNVINALLSRSSKQAIRIDSANNEMEIPVDTIQKGDVLKILPGSTIPVDGVLVNGEGGVDESMLTGEVIPVYKKQNDRVFAGSTNTNRTFLIQATSTSAQSTLSAMAALIEEAITSKPKIASLADKISSIFVPSVIFIAFAAGLVWSVMKDLSFGFEIFIGVLVISCPCALGLATPMAVMIGNAIANRAGVFLRQAQTFENAHKASSIVFDKTGTLTNAALKVVAIKSFSALDEAEILALSAGIEKGSEHLIAKAILAESNSRGIQAVSFDNFEAKAGFGIEATSLRDTGRIYALGNDEMFATSKIDGAILDSHNTNALLCVYLGIKNQDSTYQVLGALWLEDTIKQSAPSIIQTLKAHHITPYIVSGDNQANTKRIADTLGIEHYKAGAKPNDKLAFIQKLQQQGEVVIMVGDGINDVGALEAADISVSFSNASDVSEKSANIVIYNHDLMRIDYILRLSRAVVKNIKENLFWAFCYNIICIPLACGALYGAGILLNPMIAAFAMSLSSVSVVLNAQRLWKFK